MGKSQEEIGSRSAIAIGLVLIFLSAIFASPMVVASALPQFDPQVSQPGSGPLVPFYSCSSISACPMGVADYGVNGKTSYSYVAEEISSWTNFTKLTIGGTGQGLMSIQQNTVNYKVHENGKSGEYWIQDVATVDETSAGHYTVGIQDNIWNFSSPSANMGAAIYPNQLGDCSSTGGLPTFYYCVGKQVIKTTLPFEVKTFVETGILTAGRYTGHAVVIFAIHVYHSGKLVGGASFDEVAFAGKTTTAPRFQIGGTNPYGIYNDVETVLAGNCCGSTVSITSLAAHISESYSGTVGGMFVRVPHAWSSGETGEKATGVFMKSTTPGTGTASTGSDNNVQLW